ncbi:MAG TPA: hypothetical protein PLJ25_01460 [Methanothrix sp.]|nr:hypothetical protein [Methanothrix sp.]
MKNCMNYRTVLLWSAALMLSLAAGVAAGEDYLEGGYVSSYDRYGMDPGIAGMVKWLDMPVYSFPWYSSDTSFYRQAVPGSIFTPYREYYTETTGAAGTSGVAASPSAASASSPAAATAGQVVSNPVSYNINNTPYGVYYGNGQGLPYSQYKSASNRGNELWIQGATNWTEYAVIPVGAMLQLIAGVPAGGSGGFYETLQTDSVSTEYRTAALNSGYNTMNFQADRIGRYMLYFVVGSQPSNVIVVDVFQPR